MGESFKTSLPVTRAAAAAVSPSCKIYVGNYYGGGQLNCNQHITINLKYIMVLSFTFQFMTFLLSVVEFFVEILKLEFIKLFSKTIPTERVVL